MEAPADWAALRSPENYTGYERTENFASPGGAVPDAPRSYTAPAGLRLNQWALSGDWTMEEQAVTLNQADGRITCRFHARDLHLVMGPTSPGTPARFRVLVDGQPPGAAHGDDIDGEGHGTVTEPRLYAGSGSGAAPLDRPAPDIPPPPGTGRRQPPRCDAAVVGTTAMPHRGGSAPLNSGRVRYLGSRGSHAPRCPDGEGGRDRSGRWGGSGRWGALLGWLFLAYFLLSPGQEAQLTFPDQ